MDKTKTRILTDNAIPSLLASQYVNESQDNVSSTDISPQMLCMFIRVYLLN